MFCCHPPRVELSAAGGRKGGEGGVSRHEAGTERIEGGGRGTSRAVD